MDGKILPCLCGAMPREMTFDFESMGETFNRNAITCDSCGITVRDDIYVANGQNKYKTAQYRWNYSMEHSSRGYFVVE